MEPVNKTIQNAPVQPQMENPPQERSRKPDLRIFLYVFFI